MAHSSDLIAEDIEAYLVSHQYKSLLRFITCGSVFETSSEPVSFRRRVAR